MSSKDDAFQIWRQSDAPSKSKTRFFFFIYISIFELKCVFLRVRDNRDSRWPVGFPKYGHIFNKR